MSMLCYMHASSTSAAAFVTTMRVATLAPAAKDPSSRRAQSSISRECTCSVVKQSATQSYLKLAEAAHLDPPRLEVLNHMTWQLSLNAHGVHARHMLRVALPLGLRVRQ